MFVDAAVDQEKKPPLRPAVKRDRRQQLPRRTSCGNCDACSVTSSPDRQAAPSSRLPFTDFASSPSPRFILLHPRRKNYAFVMFGFIADILACVTSEPRSFAKALLTILSAQSLAHCSRYSPLTKLSVAPIRLW